MNGADFKKQRLLFNDTQMQIRIARKTQFAACVRSERFLIRDQKHDLLTAVFFGQEHLHFTGVLDFGGKNLGDFLVIQEKRTDADDISDASEELEARELLPQRQLSPDSVIQWPTSPIS